MEHDLIRRVETLGHPRILVVGDLILDRYVWGDAERISQEAPVPLLRADHREHRLGGAASVATMLRALGAEVRLVGDDFDSAKDEAERFAADQGVLFVDGMERQQYEGYSAIGDEILEQADETPAAVVVPVGNGALLGGIGMGICRRAPQVERIGVVSKAAPVMALSWEAGEAVSSDESSTFADGLAVRVAIPEAVEVLGEFASRMLQVSEREIAEAVGAYAEVGIRAEGAAAAALAAVPNLDDVGDPLVLIVTGRNIDDEIFTRACREPDSFPD
jgi:threonine dehydratase